MSLQVQTTRNSGTKSRYLTELFCWLSSRGKGLMTRQVPEHRRVFC